jgi:pimeloyl-ACP methyl ester carboxylesterase
MKRFVTIAAVFLFVTAVGGAWLYGSAATSRQAVAASPLPPGASLVKLKASDGVPLVGNYWPGRTPGSPGVVMLHGIGSSRYQFDREGAAFSARGYAVLAINFRAHGESGGELRSFGLFEARDAHAAFKWLKAKQGGARVGVLGMSLGGAAALLGDAGPVPADALVLDVVYPDIHDAIRNRIAERMGQPLGWLGEKILSAQAPLRFGVSADALSPVSAIANYRGPVFVIGGERDRYTPPAETKSLFDAAPGAKQLWIVPGAGHGAGPSNPEYMPRIEAFFDSALRPNAAPSPS